MYHFDMLRQGRGVSKRHPTGPARVVLDRVVGEIVVSELLLVSEGLSADVAPQLGHLVGPHVAFEHTPISRWEILAALETLHYSATRLGGTWWGCAF